MKTILFSMIMMMSFSSFAVSTASLGESLSPEDCVATAADKNRAAKEFITAIEDVKIKGNAGKAVEK